MIISSSFSYLFFNWRCFIVSLFRQCSIVVLCTIVPRDALGTRLQCSAVPRCFGCSGGVRLFRWCSVVPVLFCRSGGVPLFRRCSVIPRAFRVPVVFRCSASVLRSVLPCPSVPGFIVCRVLGRSVNFNIT